METIIRRPEINRVTGLSDSEIYRRIKLKTFPKPIQLGARAVGWKQSVIEAWQDEREAAGWDPNRLPLNADSPDLKCA